MDAGSAKVWSAARAVDWRNSFWAWRRARERDRPTRGSPATAAEEEGSSMAWDLARDPSSEASSRASRSLVSWRLRRIEEEEGFFLLRRLPAAAGSSELRRFFLSRIREAQCEIGFHSEKCMRERDFGGKKPSISYFILNRIIHGYKP